MKRFCSTTVLLLLLVLTRGTAQTTLSDSARAAMEALTHMEPKSLVGFLFQIVPMRFSPSSPNDLIADLEALKPRLGMAATGTLMAGENIGLTAAMGVNNLPSNKEKHAALGGRMFPEELIIDNGVNALQVSTFGLGLSYTFHFGLLRLEPALMAALVQHSEIDSHYFLKRPGENSYRDVDDHITWSQGVTAIPSLTVRYRIDRLVTRMGLMARVAYTDVTLDAARVTTTHVLDGDSTRVSSTRSYTFRSFEVGIGIYVMTF